MNKQATISFITIAILLYLTTSCSIAPHPNEKIIVGTWLPVRVEKVVDSVAILAAGGQPANAAKKTAKEGVPAQEGGGARKAELLDRLVQSEARATLEIFANHTAVKKFPGKPINATWKLKGKGTRIVAKNVENKMKFTIEILEINKERIVCIEHAPVGDVKITYMRKMD